MELRPYQQEAANAVNNYLQRQQGHCVVALPTGSGKTVIFAHLLRDWITRWPDTRAIVLAHRYELLEQAEAKIKAVWPEANVGIYSAGLGRRDVGAQVLVAGIQSVHDKADLLELRNVVIVDEAHLVPLDEESMYRRLLTDLQAKHPRMRVVGFTATPYRMDGGWLHGPDRYFQALAYEAKIPDLIEQGYLARLRSKSTRAELDTAGVATRGGDFVPGELEQHVNTKAKVAAAVDELLQVASGRQSVLVFTCGVSHGTAVLDAIKARGEQAELVIGTTDTDIRKATLEAFAAGKLRFVVNVNCLTTGLDVTGIDCIAVLRPTKSVGLWVQMVGRGFRLHPGKSDCLVLDFGGNIDRHGPLDHIKVKTPQKGEVRAEAPTKMCPSCLEHVATATMLCPACGYEWPKPEVKHDVVASQSAIIAGDGMPEWLAVDHVRVSRHMGKDGKKDTMRISYYSDGNRLEPIAMEWRCFAHPKASWPRRLALKWLHHIAMSINNLNDGIFTGDVVPFCYEHFYLQFVSYDDPYPKWWQSAKRHRWHLDEPEHDSALHWVGVNGLVKIAEHSDLDCIYSAQELLSSINFAGLVSGVRVCSPREYRFSKFKDVVGIRFGSRYSDKSPVKDLIYGLLMRDRGSGNNKTRFQYHPPDQNT